jgi:hypothetical protein
MTEAKHDDPFDQAEAIRVLAATPATARALLEGLPDDWIWLKEDAQSWNPRSVLVHLIDNERTNWIPRAKVILSEAQVRKFAPRRSSDESEFAGMPVGQLLAKFAELRRENLSALQSLDLRPSDYERQAEHPELGTVNLRQLLSTWVVHDLNHLQQITKTLAKRYRESVGPWIRYLGILER